MREQEFSRRWSDRASRYPGWSPLPPSRPIHIFIDPQYAETYAGQVAAITAASLFGRMSESVAVDVPEVKIADSLPWKSAKLDEIVMQTLGAAHQFGTYQRRPGRESDRRLIVGPAGNGLVMHGCDWGSYCGTGPSPVANSDEPNPFGAAFSVVAAASRLQLNPDATTFDPVTVDTFGWRTGLPLERGPAVAPNVALGELWCVGVGSVGSCSLFFLSLATSAFDAVLVDGDAVTVENVTRSAIFSWRDALSKRPKVDVATGWLKSAGVERVEPRTEWLDGIPDRWLARGVGTPDLLISAANERNVRSEIEAAFPPLQVYATTGRNWQATLFRHIPIYDACSLCVPGTKVPQMPTLCATGSSRPADESAEEDDLALPFLSYAAGLMTAAEIVKLAITGGNAMPNRVFFEPRANVLVRAVALNPRKDCVCRHRDTTMHRQAITGSRFADLSSG